ncbi:hypothetical protein QFC19_009128 [Naganishia cerealis]|uniref:Uncharacterized protein n=1 Tax=Naganishia cerealis TaxID=610337 RepID=A0ACC2UWG9_9TREE|nr:hypothetical protein QFC19_009128 [Naganishia cerealis]
MAKCAHLANDPRCEASFWFEDTGVQFRIAGEAVVVPNDADASPGARETLESAIGAHRVRAVGEEGKADWWVKEREKSWSEGISGHLRATFARPTPGTPLHRVDKKPEEWTETIKPEGETEEQKQEAAAAKANFTLVAIAPHTVEMLELKVVPNRRTVWTRPESPGGKWDVLAVVP